MSLVLVVWLVVMDKQIIFFLVPLLLMHQVTSQWSCSVDSDCSSLVGSVCNQGACQCRPGTQPVLGGTFCRDIAPYHTSPCYEDHQCNRLLTSYECRQDEGEDIGSCRCLPGQHYFKGRCWSSKDHGEECSHDEECFGFIRDPFSLSCTGTCQCSEGYFERQTGECRRAALSVGEGCVVNEDCQFPRGVCDITTFSCIEDNEATKNEEDLQELSNQIPKISNNQENQKNNQNISNHNMVAVDMNAIRNICDSLTPCPSPFICSEFGVCICPIGYYESPDGLICFAELGSPAIEIQCNGSLAVVIDGVCTCPPNFYFEDNMRDCVRVTRRLNESCVADVNCHTFGAAARCGPPQDPWGLRNCECIPELSVWDSARNLCRYFAGVGEVCNVDSDCLAGDLEIQCVQNEEGQGYCTCPDGLTEFEGLCLTSGLVLGESCQHDLECTGNENAACKGVCVCGDGYQEVEGSCAPALGGTCAQDSDCALENTLCRNSSTGFTCQCDESFVEYESVCWPVASSFNGTCTVSPQCENVLGSSSHCSNGLCSCVDNHHFRDGGCWPITGILESCSRTSQCFLGEDSSKVVCRNSLCQCDFGYPYSEETGTCSSSASHITASIVLFTTLLMLVT